MSGDGGDMSGGGGESGGSTKGGGGGTDYTGTSDYNYTAPTSTSTSTATPFAPTGGGGTSVDDFVHDPSQGNLTGPGPVSGGTGVPNTDYSFNNSDFLSGLDQYSGAPVSAGGTSSVFDTGTGSSVPYTSGPDQSAFASATGGQASAPAGASAAGGAAPSGVAGNPDASSTTDISSLAKKSGSAGGSGSGGTSQSSGILSSLGLGNGNGAGAAVAAAGLLNNLVNKPSSANVAGLNSAATSANATSTQQTQAGQALQQWQTTGTLPQSYESQVQRAAQDAKTRAISNAAQQGLPTDPTQNTALAQQLNAIDAAIPGQREAIASQLAQSGQQMINSGLQATGISSGVYQTLANLENSQNQATGQAIANFASALNGGSKGLTLKVA